MEIEFERTRLDECFEEAHAILAANGVTLEMAMAKLLELRESSATTDAVPEQEE